eukprot:TRINITY_DN10799_c0_g1_i8.p2 TRINITY_DN10799_c0_g1~~TRINITY_DN10799_c0_g1_i8.p2  ORF type:complete len:137 (+),score=80.24 TRINITY_DN10799_c0_g1_i8:39-449(+)
MTFSCFFFVVMFLLFLCVFFLFFFFFFFLCVCFFLFFFMFFFFFIFFFFFFFQAEDGIRDVERSRGLGDVYKRQVSTQSTWEENYVVNPIKDLIPVCSNCHTIIPVSYTHLTLPTILLVQISVVAVSLKKKKKEDK